MYCDKIARTKKGSVLALVVACMVVILIFTAFSINVARIQSSRTEIRAATDAAALAGAEALSRYDSTIAATEAAQAIAAKNNVAGNPLILEASDIHFGKSELNAVGRFEFVEGEQPFSSVRINSKQQVGLNFSGITGVEMFTPSVQSTSTFGHHEICLVLDRSASMLWDFSGKEARFPYTPRPYDFGTWYYTPPHPANSRWAGLGDAVQTFLSALSERAVTPETGMVTFSGSEYGDGLGFVAANLDVPLGSPLSDIKNKLDEIAQGRLIGATNIGAGIAMGADELTGLRGRKFSAKSLIVFTDGNWTQGDDPTVAAQLARQNGVTIYTVTLLEGDQTLMQEVAKIGGGRHFHATDAQSLKETFKELAGIVPIVLTE